jgi:ATP-binding cassette, subfamily B, bacterial HlyB/CyaB
MTENKHNESSDMEDSGLAALVTIARFHQVAADAVQLKHAAAPARAPYSW